MYYIKTAILLLAIGTLTGCGSSFDYVGYFYPDLTKKNDIHTWDINVGFYTLEQCRVWAKEKMAVDPKGDYDCAYKCPYEKPNRIDLCERLEK